MSAVQIQQTVQEYTTKDLYEALLNRTPLYVLDVRSPGMFKQNSIEGPAITVRNMPHYTFFEDEAAAMAGLPDDREILVVCAKGIVSQRVSETLATHGFNISVLNDGMQGWSEYYDVRDVVSTSAGRVVQVARPARGDLSYVVVSDGDAMVIDPLRHMEHYQQVVAEADATLTRIIDTHAHADHISGGPSLAAYTGVPYYLHPYDAIHPIDMLPATMAYEPLSGGQTFRVGQFDVAIIWFPGHTLGQVNVLVTAPGGASYLFTGDGLFLHSFGRPDLGGKGETWTQMLHKSLFERLPRAINNETLIMPAHFARLDEGGSDGRFVAPYRQVREQNEGLDPRQLEAFKAYVLDNLPEFPSQYVEIKRINLGLVTPDEETMSELETGKNACALGG
jgi:glyoxylase-like metal-dependent hydrolase (beta-lactamase superfamily II)/rhodanese-related sulfurtransferase